MRSFIFSTAVLAALPGIGNAQVNMGNVQVARLCFDAYSALIKLSVVSAEEIISVEAHEREDAPAVEEELRGNLAFLHFIAGDTTKVVLDRNLERQGGLSQAIASSVRCDSGEFCFDNDTEILASAAADLWAACRTDYLGE